MIISLKNEYNNNNNNNNNEIIVWDVAKSVKAEKDLPHEEI
jgi:hypothetical protein